MLFIGGVVSIFYRVELFCVPLILYFLLSFIAYVYSLLSCLCQFVTKRGRSRWNVGILFVLFRGGGDTLIIYDSGKYKYVWQIQVCFDVSNLGGELVCIFVVFLFIFHTCVYAFCLVFQEIYRLIQSYCCLHLQLIDSS